MTTQSIAIILQAYDAPTDTYTFGVGDAFDKYPETKALTGTEIQAIWNNKGDISLFEYCVQCVTESEEFCDVRFAGDPAELIGGNFETEE